LGAGNNEKHIIDYAYKYDLCLVLLTVIPLKGGKLNININSNNPCSAPFDFNEESYIENYLSKPFTNIINNIYFDYSTTHFWNKENLNLFLKTLKIKGQFHIRDLRTKYIFENIDQLHLHL